MKLTPEQRDDVADDAAIRYLAGESWAEIGARYDLTPQYVYRLTTARHDITFRRWGRQPLADVDEVVRCREDGQTLDQIAEDLGCSRQAIRTALETAGRTPPTRYPRLAESRTPTADEIAELRGLYEACPQAPRAREGARAVRGEEGRVLAGRLSVALGRGATWLHWLLGCHDLRPELRKARTTTRRTRS